jgi:hypothetical protein
MKFLPKFDRIFEPKNVIDNIYNDILKAVETSYFDQIGMFYEQLKNRDKDEVKAFLKEKKANILSCLDNSSYLNLYTDKHITNKETVREILKNKTRDMLGAASRYNLTVSQTAKRLCIDARNKSIIVPAGFSFVDEPHFNGFGQYLGNSYLFKFYKSNLEIFENLTNEITGQDFAVLLHFKNDCDEVLRNIEEYQSGNADIKRTIENILSKYADIIHKRFNYLESKGLHDEILPFLKDFKNALEDYPDVKAWGNINSIIDLGRGLKENPLPSSYHYGVITGFNSTLVPEKRKKLYSALIDKKYMEATPEDFEALLSGKPLQGVQIKWIDKSITKPQKANLKTVFELFLLLIDKSAKTETFNGKNKMNKIIEDCFIEGVQGGKFKNIHKGNEQNSPLQRTDRQKELKRIISSL